MISWLKENNVAVITGGAMALAVQPLTPSLHEACTLLPLIETIRR